MVRSFLETTLWLRNFEGLLDHLWECTVSDDISITCSPFLTFLNTCLRYVVTNCWLITEFTILLSILFESLKVNYVSYANYRKKKVGQVTL